MNIPEACKKLHELVDDATALRYWPKNGLYFFQEEGETWGHHSDRVISRITRCGSHEKSGRLPGRATEHRTQDSNGSLVVSHFGSALVAREGRDLHEHWGGPESRQCEDCRKLVGQSRSYVSNSIREVIVGIEKEWEKAETTAIGLLSHCGVCQRSRSWLGQRARNEVIKNGKIWNDGALDHIPTPEELERFFTMIKVAGVYSRRSSNVFARPTALNNQ